MKPLVTLARAFCVLTVLALAVSALPAAAQNYPTRPIKIIVPFGAAASPTSRHGFSRRR